MSVVEKTVYFTRMRRIVQGQRLATHSVDFPKRRDVSVELITLFFLTAVFSNFANPCTAREAVNMELDYRAPNHGRV